MTVEEVYMQAQELSAPERQELSNRLLTDTVTESHNAPNTREHLLEMLEVGMKSPTSPMTSQDWDDIRREVRERSARRRELRCE